MGDGTIPAQSFDAHRARLREVARRLLGSPAEADAAMREARSRLARAGVDEHLDDWMTAVVASVCVDLLRGRRVDVDKSHEAQLADSIGFALVIALEKLSPAKRLTFVLSDLFALPYDEIALIVDRSPAAARHLTDRARRLVQGTRLDL